jgi:hypothetical protein
MLAVRLRLAQKVVVGLGRGCDLTACEKAGIGRLVEDLSQCGMKQVDGISKRAETQPLPRWNCKKSV